MFKKYWPLSKKIGHGQNIFELADGLGIHIHSQVSINMYNWIKKSCKSDPHLKMAIGDHCHSKGCIAT